MKIKNFLILGLVLLGFTYCSSDDVLDGPTTGNETVDGVKMQLTVNMPSGITTRTTTPSDLTPEVGTANENKVNMVLVAIYKTTGEFVSATETTMKLEATNGAFFTTQEFKPEGLEIGQSYVVYTYVNPYTGLKEELQTFTGQTTDKGNSSNLDFINAVNTPPATLAGAIDAIIGESKDSFFMSNVEDGVTTIPVAATHIQGSPLKVAVNVQRAVARMDYVPKDAANTYTFIPAGLKKGETEDAQQVKVKFEGYKPMNASKSFYNLKRVNADGQAGSTATIGAAEADDNYVVDTDSDVKFGASTGWAASFHSYMGLNATTEFTTLPTTTSDIVNRFYVTENTLPANQNNKKGVATAIVFKGKLTFTDHEGTDPVYIFNNKFYSTFDALPAHIKAIGATETADLAAAGVTGYTYDTDGYPIYYVYYNVHNQLAIADASTVGPMEFGVVRNNVYKLTINNLSKLGHPNDPLGPVVNPDPNPENPTDPIKSADLYMDVSATILPWTVRTNSIEF